MIFRKIHGRGAICGIATVRNDKSEFQVVGAGNCLALLLIGSDNSWPDLIFILTWPVCSRMLDLPDHSVPAGLPRGDDRRLDALLPDEHPCVRPQHAVLPLPAERICGCLRRSAEQALASARRRLDALLGCPDPGVVPDSGRPRHRWLPLSTRAITDDLSGIGTLS